jgi:hypothetical protein
MRRSVTMGSRPHAVEERNILFGLQEARHPLVSRTMLSCDRGCAFKIAAISDLGRTCIALNEERLRSRAPQSQAARQSEREYPPKPHLSEAKARRENGKRRSALSSGGERRRSLRSRIDQRLDQLHGMQ